MSTEDLLNDIVMILDRQQKVAEHAYLTQKGMRWHSRAKELHAELWPDKTVDTCVDV